MNITPPRNEPIDDPIQPPARNAETARTSHPLPRVANTPIVAERRQARHRRRAARARRTAVIASVAVCAVLAVAFGGRFLSGPGAAGVLLAQRSSSRAMAIVRAAPPVAQPTPLFASRGSLALRLPVAATDLTEVGFHQAAFDYALPIKTPLPDADMKAAKRKKGSARDISAQETGPDAVLVGSVLRMWRDRPGKPNTAADVGAAPGSQVLSPMDGTVVLVKRYKLYGKHSDVQIHIRPDGAPDVDCVLIHIKDPQVKAGDRVIAGVSPLGAVRRLSSRMNLQLGHYTPDGGDHVHLQLNDATHPDYRGLDGAVIASGS